ncbi:MAG TPA: choice-of-anchor J domain-containing protein [Salinivirgaceae bacterium]|nr:choice-of-anchor J domain-containing protein [Salinivirgaceae bacterium]
MKKTLLLLTLSSMRLLMVCQPTELPISNRFENYEGINISSSYPGWAEGNGEGTPAIGESAWFLSNILYSKAACVQIAETDKRAWLLTPFFMATAETQLSFNAAMTIFDNDPEPAIMGPTDFFKVMVQVGNSNFTELMVFDKDHVLPVEMQSFTLSLQQFAGSEIRIGFLAIDGNQAGTYATWHIDDVFITNATAPDVAAEEILLPQWQQCLEESTPVTVRIKNNDLAPVSQIPIRVKIRGAHNQNLFNVYQGTLQPGETKTIVVGNANLSLEGTYEIEAETELPSDVFAENNRSNRKIIKNTGIRQLPLPVMTFTDFYTDNLNAIYPDWNEARGRLFPKVIMDTDWQAEQHPQSRTATVFYSGLGTNDWLIGPMIIPTAQTYVAFKAAYEWYQGPTQMGSDDRLSVMVSTNCGLDWSEVGTITRQNNLGTNLTPFFFSLGNYAGQTIRVAIYATSGNVSDPELYLLHIDDLEVRNISQNDLAIGNLVSPTTACSFGAGETLTVEISNLGQNPITNPQISYSLNGQPSVTETINQTINPGATIEYSFAGTLNLTGQASHNLEISLSDDDDATNNHKTFILKPASFDLNTMGDYFSGFETDAEGEGWTVVNANNDGHFWQIVNDPTYAYHGTHSYNYQSNNSSQTSNDWLFSPCFTLEAGNTYFVQFYYKNRATSYPEKLRFRLHSSTTPQSSVMILNDFGDITNSTYLSYQTTFSPTTTGTYYFAWEAYGPADMYGMYIDNVTIRRVFNYDLTISSATVLRKKQTGTCQLSPSDSIKVTIENIGSNSINEFSLNVSADNGETVVFASKQYSQTIAAGSSTTVFFDQLELSSDHLWNIQIEVDAANDQNAVNDMYLMNNFDLKTYFTSFEVPEEINEWTVIDLQGTNSWQIYTSADFAHTGLNSFRIRTDQQPTNDWLISGCNYLKAGVCYDLSFFYRSRYSYETLEVTIGTSPNPASMTNLLTIDNFNTNIYQQALVQFSVPADGVYYLAFHVQQGTSQKYYIHVDDVTLKVSDQTMTIDPTYEVLDTEVLFNANGRFISNYLWNFGDGSTSNEPNPSHVYPEAGTYTVTLTANGACGTLSQSFTVVIESQLTVDFTFDVEGPVVHFEAITSAPSASWNFGDGNFNTGMVVTNQYLFAGNHTVTLTVYDGISSNSISKTVTTTVNNIENLQNETIWIYPNPTHGNCTVSGLKPGQTLLLYDLSGRVLRQQLINHESIVIDLSNIASGCYLLKVIGLEKPITIIKL